MLPQDMLSGMSTWHQQSIAVATCLSLKQPCYAFDSEHWTVLFIGASLTEHTLTSWMGKFCLFKQAICEVRLPGLGIPCNVDRCQLGSVWLYAMHACADWNEHMYPCINIPLSYAYVMSCQTLHCGIATFDAGYYVKNSCYECMVTMSNIISWGCWDHLSFFC